MTRKLRNRSGVTIAALLIGLLALAFSAPANNVRAADNRSIYWQRWDVLINNIDTTNNVFHVKETHVLMIDVGPFNGGDREIPMERMTGISNVIVKDGSTTLQALNQSADSCGTQRGIVCLSQSGGQQVIYYNFVRQANSGDTRTITIDYDVQGSLRSYPDGDQMYWVVLAYSRPASVRSSTVTVQMPTGVLAQKFAADPTTWQITNQDNQTMIFKSPGDLGTNGNVEVRIQYPHNPAMAVPSWQAASDRLQTLGPWLGVLSLVLSGLITIGGLVWLFMKYTSHKRGLPPIVVPEYLTEPPSDQPPAVAATLLHEDSRTPDVMATMFDLARRGLIVIEQEQHKGVLGIGGSTDFTFHRTDQQATNLRPYEQTMMTALFAGGTTRKLSDLRNTFYKTVESIKSMLYDEVVSAGYFKQSPQSVQSGWVIAGIGLIVLAIAIGYGAFNFKALSGVTTYLLGPLGAVGLIGTAMVLVSGMMRSRTAAGEQESAKWKAFRTYLANINKYTDLKQATDQFEKYIGYAIAFGLDKQWIGQFSQVMTSMPNWYYPTYLYGPWTGRYPMYGGSSMQGLSQQGGGNFANWGGNSSGGGLNAMNNSLGEGLKSMNTGLATLLTSASAVMTSTPSSSGSSGGFSGGGSHGGGGGGGSAGFH